MPSQSLRGRVRGAPEVIEAAYASKISEGVLVSGSGAVSLVGWTPILTAEQKQTIETIASTLAAAGAEPPSTEELAAAVGDDVPALLRYMERCGSVTQVEQNRYYDTSQLKLLLGRVRQALAGSAEVGPSELREALGLSRKFLIPLLEYCDRVGYTNRSAMGRVWRRA